MRQSVDDDDDAGAADAGAADAGAADADASWRGNC